MSVKLQIRQFIHLPIYSVGCIKLCSSSGLSFLCNNFPPFYSLCCYTYTYIAAYTFKTDLSKKTKSFNKGNRIILVYFYLWLLLWLFVWVDHITKMAFGFFASDTAISWNDVEWCKIIFRMIWVEICYTEMLEYT